MHGRKTELAELGYTVLPDYMGQLMLDRMRARVDELFAAEGDAAGSEFRTEENARRLANLVDKGEVFREAIVKEEILDLVGSVLGKNFKLGSLNVRSAMPESHSLQPLHVDMGLLPDAKGYASCNCVWMLDDFTVENGALRVNSRFASLGKKATAGAARWIRTAPTGDSSDRSRWNRGGDERARMARRNRKSNQA